MGLWRIRYFGRFEIFGPDGEPIFSPRVKAKVVIALLAMNRKYGMSRDELGGILWGDCPATSRRDNVKQTLSTVRKIIGEENLLLDLDRCRLSEGLEIESDLDNPSAQSKPFMPGFGGEWFEDRRSHYEATSDETFSSESVSKGLETVLRWYAQSDPDQMFEAMRSNVYLTIGIGPATLAQLLKTAGPRKRKLETSRGWDLFWQGYSKLGLDVDGPIAPLRTSLSLALDQGDCHLATESLIWWGYSSILRGRHSQARKLVEMGEQITVGPRNEAHRARVMSLKGTVHIHGGRVEEGVEHLLATSSALENNTIEWAQNQALCALYLACDEKIERSQQLLELPKSVAQTTRHTRLQLICDLTEAHVRLAQRSLDQAGTLFQKVYRDACRERTVHFQIYGLEGLANTRWRSDEKAESRVRLREAKQLRTEANMPYTNWDRLRLRVQSA